MIHGEDLRLGIRSLLGRPAESVLLAVAVAFAVGATFETCTVAVSESVCPMPSVTVNVTV